MVAAALAAIMSTSSGALIATATVAKEDIVGTLLRRRHAVPSPVAAGGEQLTPAQEHDEVGNSRWYILAFGVVVIAIACVLGDVVAALTIAYDILVGGLLATFTVSPALSALILPKKLEERDTLIVRFLRAGHERILAFGLKNRVLALSGMLVVLLASGLAARNLGLEFLPRLEEGNLYVRGTMPSSISLEAGNDYVQRPRKIFQEVPEVVTVISHQGRLNDGSDATGFFNVEVDGTQGRTGRLVEVDETSRIFTTPSEKATEDYISGRFG